MDQRTSVLVGSALLIVGSIVMLVYSAPSLRAFPAVIGVLSAVAISVGTLLVGTSSGTV